MLRDEVLAFCEEIVCAKYENVTIESPEVSLPEAKTIEELDANITSTNLTHESSAKNSTQDQEEAGWNNEDTNKTQKCVQCLPGMGNGVVQITNDTELIKILQPDSKVTDRDSPALCVLVLFYSKYCPFSSMAAPHFNALPRAFPDIKMVAINAMIYHLFNTQNGIVGVPSLMLFYNGRSVAKFNQSEYTLERFSEFVTKHTCIPAVEKSIVTSADFNGPVVSLPSKDSDFFLILSWVFIVLCSSYYFAKSKWWKWIVETVQRNWRESEAQLQHEHAD
ncbi:unnamed protein product [Callosobruchus maculatus]|uniref:Thioredoxin domain-containing protein n=1 Tax=Callosobruchus maculatus TaxID=64391 RepID=A0A653CG05_CALMS|nr:unnamed protein product [Callosobruchus maculatus]